MDRNCIYYQLSLRGLFLFVVCLSVCIVVCPAVVDSPLQAVSVCRGGDLYVWDLVKGAKLEQKTWNPSKSTQYRFRAIR